MKKIIIFVCFLLCLQVVEAQRSALFISEDRLFYEGKNMFDDKNYAGCIDKLREYLKVSKNTDLIQESEFLLINSAYRQGRKDAGLGLKNYLDNYPETRHFDEVCFMIGSTHFGDGDYSLAIYWLNRAEIDNLSARDQEDYAYRMAYSCLKTERLDDALRLFSALKDNSTVYKDPATYYLAYIHYVNKNYNDALPLFSKLKDNSTFRPEVLYYLTQINFVQGRYTQTIKEGNELLANFQNNAHNTEINRIVGVSYYYEGEYNNAVQYLSKYVQTSEAPLRNDLYLLGLSHFNLKNYEQAAKFLSKSITGNDEMGQNAYLYLGQAYLKLGDKKDALMAFEAASRVNFNAQVKEEAMYNYAMLLHQTSVSPFGESVIVLENFLNDYPKSKYADKVSDCLVEVYLTTKNYQTALKSIDKIKNPGTKILEAKQKIFYHLGTVGFINNDFTGAVDYFSKAINAGNYAPSERDNAEYWRAESYYKQERYGLAEKDFQSFLQTANKDAGLSVAAYYGLGYSYFKQKQYSAAQTEFSNYISREKDPSKTTLADAYARLGDCYFYNRRFADAENAYSKSSELQPEMADYAIFQNGFVMGLRKDYKGKVAQMDKLINTYPDSRYVTDAMYEKGRAYVMMENPATTIQIYETLVNKYPESSNARKAGIQLGLLYFNANQPQKAAAAYKKVIDKYPGSDEAKVAVQDLKSVYVELNEVDAYAQYVNSLGGMEKFEPSEQDSLTYIAAERFFMKGDVKQAQDAMKKYIQSYPDGAFRVNAHYYLGSIYQNQKDPAGAKAEFQKVLQAGDTKFTEDALVHLSGIEYAAKDYAAALPLYQRLQNVSESKANKEIALLGIMRSSGQLNKYTEMLNASNSLLKETKLDPAISTEATYLRAKAYMGLDQKAKAMTDLTTLSKDTRTVYGAEAKYLVAQYHFDQKEVSKAESEVLEYIQKGTPHSYWLARSFILLSDIYFSKKDYMQARQYLESLEHNYKGQDDDIAAMIAERLSKIDNSK